MEEGAPGVFDDEGEDGDSFQCWGVVAEEDDFWYCSDVLQHLSATKSLGGRLFLQKQRQLVVNLFHISKTRHFMNANDKSLVDNVKIYPNPKLQFIIFLMVNSFKKLLISTSKTNKTKKMIL